MKDLEIIKDILEDIKWSNRRSPGFLIIEDREKIDEIEAMIKAIIYRREQNNK